MTSSNQLRTGPKGAGWRLKPRFVHNNDRLGQGIDDDYDDNYDGGGGRRWRNDDELNDINIHNIKIRCIIHTCTIIKQQATRGAATLTLLNGTL